MTAPSSQPPPPDLAVTVAENEWLTFRTSRIHGTGGFARQDIPSGTSVIEYIGEIITKDVANERCEAGNPYIFFLDDTRDLDGNVPWNPARFLNHSCDPNCEAQEDEGRLWIVSVRAIAAGEEVTFDYGYSLEDYRSYPCLCGAKNCFGYILAEEHRQELLRSKTD